MFLISIITKSVIRNGISEAIIVALVFLTLSFADCRADGVKIDSAIAIPSFIYAGKKFDPSQWKSQTRSIMQKDADVIAREQIYVSPDGLLQLKLTIKEYECFGIIEWVPELSNIGNQNTGVIESFRSLSLSEEIRVPVVFVRRYVGSRNDWLSFSEQVTPLNGKKKRPLATPELQRLQILSNEGRSSSLWMPYFAIDYGAMSGFNVAVGWSGSWVADISYESNKLSVSAGMLKTHFKLFPGETLRQPSIFVMKREGMSVEDGQNMHRRFMLAYKSPRDSKGNLLVVPYSFMVSGCTSGEKQMAMIEKIKKEKLDYDVFWDDAGWYGPEIERPDSLYKFNWESMVGDWRINKKVFPNGIKPIARAANDAGMKFMLWIEIERAYRGTAITKEYPELFNSSDYQPWASLLDLGKTAGLKYAFDTVDYFLENEGVDYYRQDFNMTPAPIWERMDTPDRVGVSEMKHIAGLYAFWDALREKHPDMLIDNCASGGRRLDFELLSRSIALWRDDAQCDESKDTSSMSQIQIYYLSMWVPLNAGGVRSRTQDDYGWFSALSAGMSRAPDFSLPFLEENFPVREESALLQRMRRMSAYFLGDFYPLVKHPEIPDNWSAFQLDIPEEGKGCFIAFRRGQSAQASQTMWLRKIDARATYEIEDYTGFKKTMNGAELEHFKVSLNPESFALYYYRKL